MSLLFVYGSLKSGEYNNRHMRGTLLGKVRTKPLYRLVNCGFYPGLQTGERSIEGELWEVASEDLKSLDYFEGVHKNVYRRQPVELENNTQAEAYFYLHEASEYEGDCWHGRNRNLAG